MSRGLVIRLVIKGALSRIELREAASHFNIRLIDTFRPNPGTGLIANISALLQTSIDHGAESLHEISRVATVSPSVLSCSVA